MTTQYKKLVGILTGVLLALVSSMPAMAADKPQDLQRSPIAAFKNGFTLEQSKKFLSERDL